MSDNLTRSPLERTIMPAGDGRDVMTIGRERAAFAAMEALRAMGAHPLTTHRLPNGIGYIAPDTGRVHGPALFGPRPADDGIARF